MIDFIMNLPRMIEGFMVMLFLVVLAIFAFIIIVETWKSNKRRKKDVITK